MQQCSPSFQLEFSLISKRSGHSSASELYRRTSYGMRLCNPSSRSISIGKRQGLSLESQIEGTNGREEITRERKWIRHEHSFTGGGVIHTWSLVPNFQILVPPYSQTAYQCPQVTHSQSPEPNTSPERSSAHCNTRQMSNTAGIGGSSFREPGQLPQPDPG